MRLSHRALWAVCGSLVLGGCASVGPAGRALPENFRQVSSRLYSSGEPVKAATFQALRREGITTVISVDGAAPQVKPATKNGMKYVHLPIGYDRVPEPTIKALDEVLKSSQGKVLIHCHHGKHRGPAVAVIASMIEGSISKEDALETLKEAGTSPDYAGLWRSVRQFQGVPHNVRPQKITEQADIDPLAASMVMIDQAFESLEKRLEESKISSSSLTEYAVTLNEGFLESMRAAETGVYYPDPRQRLIESQKMSAELLAAVRSRQWPQAKQIRARLKDDCRTCHQQFRN